jgi:hypothetical protein
MRELFVEELQLVTGASGGSGKGKPCPRITTLACGEEQPPCSSCDI